MWLTRTLWLSTLQYKLADQSAPAAVPVLCLQEIQVSTLMTFCHVLCINQHFIKNQAFGPASLECAALGQVAARLAFSVADKLFVNIRCFHSRHLTM